MQTMIRMREVLVRTQMSRTTLWRKIRSGTFPAPLELSENIVAFEESAVVEWLKNRPRRTYGAALATEPPQAA
jgi:prophage regulatory protein